MNNIFKTVALSLTALLYAAQAATLDIYRDGAQYTLKTPSTFIGFAPKNVEAVCGDVKIQTFASTACKESSSLCALKKRIDRDDDEATAARTQMRLIDTMVNQSKPQTMDAKAWLYWSEKIANRYAALQKKATIKEREAKRLRELFLSMAPSLQARYLSHACGKNLQLNIPAGLIGVDIFYEADLPKSGELTIRSVAELRNRSGIDIDVTRADIYFVPIARVLRPIEFRPWIIRESRIVPMGKSRMERSMAMTQAVPAPDEANIGKISHEKTRHYRIQGLHLPSSGEALQAEVGRFKSDFTKQNVVFPYTDPRVYEAVRFKPPFTIENDRWRIKSGKRVVARKVYGRYDGDEYLIFMAVDHDLIVRREPYISKSGEHGIIFGKKVKKTDGYTLEVINASAQKKALHIVERIPVSTKDEVEVELIDVKADQPMKYRLQKRGKLTIDLTIPPRKSTRVDVRFRVTWPKDMPVVY